MEDSYTGPVEELAAKFANSCLGFAPVGLCANTSAHIPYTRRMRFAKTCNCPIKPSRIKVQPRCSSAMAMLSCHSQGGTGGTDCIIVIYTYYLQKDLGAIDTMLIHSQEQQK